MNGMRNRKRLLIFSTILLLIVAGSIYYFTDNAGDITHQENLEADEGQEAEYGTQPDNIIDNEAYDGIVDGSGSEATDNEGLTDDNNIVDKQPVEDVKPVENNKPAPKPPAPKPEPEKPAPEPPAPKPPAPKPETKPEPKPELNTDTGGKAPVTDWSNMEPLPGMPKPDPGGAGNHDIKLPGN